MNERTLWDTARPALLVGVAALVLLCIGGVFDGYHFFRAYLLGWLLCLGASLGALAMVMMHHLTGGDWGWPVRRPGEAAAATLPFVALAFIPLMLGARWAFPWADPSAVEHSEVLRHRLPVFTTGFTLGRSVVFLLIWIGLAWMLNGWSLAHDRTGEPRLLERMRRFSAFGIVVIFITMSLASVDWIASREPDWYSSTFGFVTILGQSITGLCVLLVAIALLQREPVLQPTLHTKAVHDLGNLLQTTVVLWAYVSFAQYLVIWSGNMQEDLIWFHHRTQGGWSLVGTAIIVLHFGLPFVLLLFQRAKRQLISLGAIAGGLLFMRVVDATWMIVPSTEQQSARSLHWLDPLGIIALGALWWPCFIWQLKRRPLVPLARRAFVPEPLAVGDDVREGVPS